MTTAPDDEFTPTPDPRAHITIPVEEWERMKAISEKLDQIINILDGIYWNTR